MIAVIENISATRFQLNGIPYPKTFLPFVVGSKIKVINVYDSDIELVTPSSLGDFTVDGAQPASLALLQEALIPVLFTKSSIGAITVNGQITNIDLQAGNVIEFTLADTSVIEIDLSALDQAQGLADHIGDMDNPHGVTSAQLNLGNVDNTSDNDKPISAAAQSAFDNKVDKGFTVIDIAAPGDKTDQWVIGKDIVGIVGGGSFLGFSTVPNPTLESDFDPILAAR